MSSVRIAQRANDIGCAPGQMDKMNKIVRTQGTKQPARPHYIPEWAAHRGYETQADLVRALEADKSVVSRWYAGATPGTDWQERLAALFHCEPESLFRHPDEDWMTRFFRDRAREEVERIKRVLELTFPRKAG